MMITRRSMILSPVALAGSSIAAAVMRHISVYAKPGRFGGWPANFGIWNWGNEIACGFGAAYYLKGDPERHLRDRNRPIVPAIARSIDGGESWSVTEPPSLLPPDQGGPSATDLREPMDFRAQGFALTMRSQDRHDLPSLFWYSQDRANTWSGPFRLPSFGRKGVSARTDYLVLGQHEALVFLTATKTDGTEGHAFCAHTQDGGVSWTLRSWIGKEPEGFSIMPSTVQLPSGRILAAVRVKKDATTDWIDLYASDDRGFTWQEFARPVPFSGGKSGNPPSLKRLPDGRLSITWGYRGEPYGIRATVSDDDGKTWSPHIMLRNDGGAWDLGYTRDAIRSDGKLVTIYYWSPSLLAEREIVATIWDPGRRGK